DKVISATDWMRVVNDQIVSVQRDFAYLYDEFGRMQFRVMPGGDSAESPTETYQYDLRSPASRIITRRRSAVGGPLDQELIACIDGRGRTYQTRIRLASGEYVVDGYQVFNVRSNPVREYQPYNSTSDQCDTTPPEGVLFTEFRYDATRRPLQVTQPDAGIYGTASITQTEYRPLTLVGYDTE
ncbi:MAG: hypothetical protein AAFX99_37370, partial [Myxococcota bacterium]